MEEKNSYMDRILTVPCCNNNSAMEAMAMQNNNPWMYLVMLALFGNGGWGNTGRFSVSGYLYYQSLEPLFPAAGEPGQGKARRSCTRTGDAATRSAVRYLRP